MALIIIIFFFSSVNFYFLTGVELNFLQRRSRLKVSKRKKGENLGVKKHGGSVGWPAHLPLFLLGRSQRVGRTRIHRFCIYIYILYLRLLVYLFLYLLMCVIYERENGGNWWRVDERGKRCRVMGERMPTPSRRNGNSGKHICPENEEKYRL